MNDLIQEYLHQSLYNDTTSLCQIMKTFGSDKGLGWHNYTTFYDFIFKEIKDSVKHVFELGLGTNNINLPSNMGINGKPGASLYGWNSYFKNATIYGADIDKDILFQTENIKTFYVDQTDEESVKHLWNTSNTDELLFDIFIDDGLHEFSANLNFLKHSIHKVAKGGYYIIEDLKQDTASQFKNMLGTLKQDYNLSFIDIIAIPHENTLDNTILLIQV